MKNLIKLELEKETLGIFLILSPVFFFLILPSFAEMKATDFYPALYNFFVGV